MQLLKDNIKIFEVGINMTLADEITSLKGIGEKTAKYYQKLGIRTVSDLILYFPRNYEAFENVVEPDENHIGVMTSVSCRICKLPQTVHIKKLTITNIQTICCEKPFKITFFNMPYIKNVYKLNQVYIFRACLKKNKTGYFMEQPKMYHEEEYNEKIGHLQPIYPITNGISSNAIMKTVHNAEKYIALLEEYIPDEILEQYHLQKLNSAVYKMHFPDSIEEYTEARRRFAFDEFLEFLLSVKLMKRKNKYLKNAYPMIEVAQTSRLQDALPYSLTKAQERVWNEVKMDLQSQEVMNRMIQGDVGSGKTIIAFLAMFMTAANGYQAVLMAPTEVLARQHYEQLSSIMKQFHFSFEASILTGSTPARQRREIHEKLEEGTLSFLIGTHAVFQENVSYKNLALVITDEQHRFGVRQREMLVHKGTGTNVLVMSATPIPRSLAMILYSDMNLSVIDELPAGRRPIKNCVVNDSYRETAYHFMEKEVRDGRQVYIICPMIEENSENDLMDVHTCFKLLKAKMPEEVQIAILHGKMKNEEKNNIMELYLNHKIDILISTTVIEVGINVPNATVMMIENAEHFGLASLHQLRGRVGRGGDQSYCIFMNRNDKSRENERLQILLHSNDGFEIANQDLKLRGPGDMTGIAQSGDIPFDIADIYQDSEILKIAERAADQILNEDDTLSSDKYKKLTLHMSRIGNNQVDFRTI